MSPVRPMTCIVAALACALVSACGYRLPGAMGPSETPLEIRQRHGASAMYLNEPREAAAKPAAKPAAAPAAKPDAGSTPGRTIRQAALSSGRGKQGPGQPPGAIRYGDLFFISGQLPTDVRGNPTADTRIEEQTRLALENVRAILEANQMTMGNIVSTTVYLKDLADMAAFDSVYATYFKDAPPSRSVVEVARLPDNAKVEIAAVAGR